MRSSSPHSCYIPCPYYPLHVFVLTILGEERGIPTLPQTRRENTSLRGLQGTSPVSQVLCLRCVSQVLCLRCVSQVLCLRCVSQVLCLRCVSQVLCLRCVSAVSHKCCVSAVSPSLHDSNKPTNEKRKEEFGFFPSQRAVIFFPQVQTANRTVT
jgi:hypothetical protein